MQPGYVYGILTATDTTLDGGGDDMVIMVGIIAIVVVSVIVVVAAVSAIVAGVKDSLDDEI